MQMKFGGSTCRLAKKKSLLGRLLMKFSGSNHWVKDLLHLNEFVIGPIQDVNILNLLSYCRGSRLILK